eukprot:13186574-Ditylum_brightwellii.AAC.1
MLEAQKQPISPIQDDNSMSRIGNTLAVSIQIPLKLQRVSKIPTPKLESTKHLPHCEAPWIMMYRVNSQICE